MSNRHTGKRARSDFDSNSDSDSVEVEIVPNAKRARNLPSFLRDGDEAARLDQWDLILEGRMETVSIEALFEACRTNRLDVVKMLLEHYKVDINGSDHAGDGLLHVPIILRNTDCVHLLLERGINPNTQRSTDNQTPLSIACAKGYWQCVQLLLEYKAKPMMFIGNNNETPLFIACLKGHDKCARCILEHDTTTIHIPSENGATPLYAACYNGHVDCVSLLLENGAVSIQGNCVGETPLFTACQRGHAECVRLILKHDTRSIQIPAKKLVTPLLTACCRGHTDCARLILSENTDTINMPNTKGGTPLAKACRRGHTECVRLLLSHGANAEQIVHKSGTTSLSLTCYMGRIDCVRLLLEHGVSVVNDTKYVNIAFANKHWDIAALLLAHGAKATGKYALLQPHRISSRKDTCAVCLETDKELVTFAPCAHACCCHSCMISMMERKDELACPLCRAKVTSTFLLATEE